ncbi:hypothetical protein LOD99_2589 [Oopsacas minuta]|uniref:Uncharacterized protein n=1 Tax=Oopsacas minuta TaxID=111878 RepID=A0AAV7K1S8_9METZ|nr:hypothetical protein LOD99_2589 [Oopsacas minuta]
MREKLDLSSTVSLEDSELEQISLTGYLPQGDIVLQGPVSGYFCGDKRWRSPFAPQKPMQSPSDVSLLKCMEADCRELNLKAQFLHYLPDISLLAKKLTVLNLSFNMFKVVSYLS